MNTINTIRTQLIRRLTKTSSSNRIMKKKRTLDLLRTVLSMKIVTKVLKKSILNLIEICRCSQVRDRLMVAMNSTLLQKVFWLQMWFKSWKISFNPIKLDKSWIKFCTSFPTQLKFNLWKVKKMILVSY